MIRSAEVAAECGILVNAGHDLTHLNLPLLVRELPNLAEVSIGHHLISRALQHGVRRAEEMREAAVTVAGAHLEPLMSEATAARQEWTAALPSPPASFQLRQTLDFLRGELGKGEVK